MKRFLCLLMVFVLIFVTGCSTRKSEANDQKTDSVNTETNTVETEKTETKDTATENKTEEKTETEETDDNETVDKVETKPTQKEEKPSTNTQKPAQTKPTTDNKTENKEEKPAETVTPKPSETQPSNPEPEPENKPEVTPVEKPYFVSLDFVSADRTGTAMVGNTDLLSKIFGQNTTFKIGDAITYKVNMSDGGTTGFKIVDLYTSNCEISVKGNLITMKIVGNANSVSSARFVIAVDTKDGGQKEVSQRVGVRKYDEERLLQEYAKRKGLIFAIDGNNKVICEYEKQSCNVSNPEWLSQAIAIIDEAASLGYKYCCFSVINLFDFVAGNRLENE